MPANGTLIVRTYASEAQLPIVGTTVSVTQQTPDGTRLLATRITDRSGRTAPITIETPPRVDSESPAAAGAAIPWTNVDILAEHPNYERVLIENGQIFAGVVTEQNIQMLPLEVNPELFNVTEIIDTTPQAL